MCERLICIVLWWVRFRGLLPERRQLLRNVGRQWRQRATASKGNDTKTSCNGKFSFKIGISFTWLMKIVLFYRLMHQNAPDFVWSTFCGRSVKVHQFWFQTHRTVIRDRFVAITPLPPLQDPNLGHKLNQPDNQPDDQPLHFYQQQLKLRIREKSAQARVLLVSWVSHASVSISFDWIIVIVLRFNQLIWHIWQETLKWRICSSARNRVRHAVHRNLAYTRLKWRWFAMIRFQCLWIRNRHSSKSHNTWLTIIPTTMCTTTKIAITHRILIKLRSTYIQIFQIAIHRNRHQIAIRHNR